MRAGITVNVTSDDRRRLKAIVSDRNAPQKHVWRAQIILATADGCGTTRDHAPVGQVETGGVDLAGALHGGTGRWADARQDAQARQAAAAGGNGTAGARS